MKQTRDYPLFTISRKGERWTDQGHPWIYAAEILDKSEEPPNGALCDAVGEGGKYIGTGFYTFTYKMPVEVGQSGDYFFDSYLAEMENDEMVSYSCGNYYQFIINDPNTTNIEETIALDDKNGEWFDLNGRRLSGKPNSKGVYIHNGRKHIIK